MPFEQNFLAGNYPQRKKIVSERKSPEESLCRNDLKKILSDKIDYLKNILTFSFLPNISVIANLRKGRLLEKHNVDDFSLGVKPIHPIS